jgi:hypothetical protein
MPPVMEKTQEPLANLPATQDVLAVAGRINWYKDSHEAISDTTDFLAHLMTYGRPEDLEVIRQYLTIDDFRKALEHAAPGIMDSRSWNYWNIVTGRIPVPPMPERHIP